MKTGQEIQRVLVTALLVFSLLSFSSCGENKKDANGYKEDSKEIAEDMNDARFEAKDKQNDANFLAEVAELYLTEIKFGQLAKNKSGDTDIIKLGRMMETDHTKALEEVTSLAKSKQVTLPTAISQKTQEKYDNFKALNPKDFDKKYADMMVSGHKDAIALFEKTLKNTKDVDINNWVEKKLPGLRMHLEHSETCQKNLK